MKREKGYSAERYESLYGLEMLPPERGEADASPGEQMTMEDWARQLREPGQGGQEDTWEARLRHERVLLYRTKRIRAGEQLYLKVYPVYSRSQDAGRAKRSINTEAQQRYRQKQARERLRNLVNANFGSADIWATLTYDGEPPRTMEQAQRDMANYIRRVNRWRERRGMEKARYVYVIEWEDDGEERRIHHHIIMDGMDRDAAEALWQRGRTQTRHLQPDDKGLEAMAAYVSKGARKHKRQKKWGYSKGLRQPVETVADHKISKRQVNRMADMGWEAIMQAVRRAEPGYDLKEADMRRSEFMPGAYITVTMTRRRKGGGEECRSRWMT